MDPVKCTEGSLRILLTEFKCEPIRILNRSKEADEEAPKDNANDWDVITDIESVVKDYGLRDQAGRTSASSIVGQTPKT